MLLYMELYKFLNETCSRLGPVGRQFSFPAAEECDKLFTDNILGKGLLLLENAGGSVETVCDCPTIHQLIVFGFSQAESGHCNSGC